MFNCKKTQKWIFSKSTLLIVSIAVLIISYTWLIAVGKAVIDVTPVIAASIAALLAPWIDCGTSG